MILSRSCPLKVSLSAKALLPHFSVVLITGCIGYVPAVSLLASILSIALVKLISAYLAPNNWFIFVLELIFFSLTFVCLFLFHYPLSILTSISWGFLGLLLIVLNDNELQNCLQLTRK